MVASHTAVPLGTAKWLVWATPPFYTLPLGKGHMQPLSPTQGQAKFLWGLFLSSHFAVPKGTTVWLATFVRCLRHLLTTSSLLTVSIWCIWHYFVGNPCLMPLASFHYNWIFPILFLYAISLLLDITNARARYTRITNPAEQAFVK